MVPVSSWTTGSFGLLKMFRRAICGMATLSGCNSLLLVFEMFVMYGRVVM